MDLPIGLCSLNLQPNPTDFLAVRSHALYDGCYSLEAEYLCPQRMSRGLVGWPGVTGGGSLLEGNLYLQSIPITS
jgi:hypothetical protein